MGVCTMSKSQCEVWTGFCEEKFLHFLQTPPAHSLSSRSTSVQIPGSALSYCLVRVQWRAGGSAVGSGGVSIVVQHQVNWNQESPPVKSWYPRASPASSDCRTKLWVFNLVYFVPVASVTPEKCFLQVDILGITTVLQVLYGETWEAKG